MLEALSGFADYPLRTATDVRTFLHGLHGQGCDSVVEACTGADLVITMLPDSPDVEHVVCGPGGVLDSAAPGTLLVDMSTIRPDVARQLADAGSIAGMPVLDAPVSGGEQAAVDGTLSIMVGGDQSAFEEARSVLDLVGSTVVRVGASGAGQLVKAANQLIVAGNIQLVAEAVTLLEATDVDLDLAIQVLSAGLAGSAVLDRKSRAMRSRDFQPGFRVDLHHKDLGIALETARISGTATPLGSAVAVLMGSLRAQGHGALDHTALLLLAQQMSGRLVEG